MPNDATLTEAWNLAEAINDAVVRTDQDWRQIERDALALAALARRLAEELEQ